MSEDLDAVEAEEVEAEELQVPFLVRVKAALHACKQFIFGKVDYEVHYQDERGWGAETRVWWITDALDTISQAKTVAHAKFFTGASKVKIVKRRLFQRTVWRKSK